jgi:hypothetical protein
MKIKLQVAFIALLLSSVLYSQVTYSPIIDSLKELCTQQKLSKTDRQLSGDTSCMIGGNPYTLVSRHWNTVHNNMAAQFIYEQFLAYGLTPLYMDFTATGRNVYAVKTGTKYPNKKFIICAHYDDMPSGALAPGADDNASGTSAVMEAARILAPYQFDYTIIFIAFDEEERGLYGSHAYADSCFNRGDSIMFVFNYDMISWDGNNDYRLDMISNSNSAPFSDIVKIVYNLYVPLMYVNRVTSNMSGSDHYYFWQRGYKAFCGIEDNNDFHPYYHTVNDNFANVKVNYFHGFTRAAIAALMMFSWDYLINFTHTPIVNTNSTQPQVAVVTIKSPQILAKITNGPRLYYKVNSGSYNFVNAFYNNLDTFKFQIPGQAYGSAVSYYIAAQDSLGRFVGTLPTGGKGINPPGTIVPPTVFTYSVLTGISSNQQPEKYQLEQNYPNPFNASTNIRLSLIKAANIKLTITNVLGEVVSVPAEGRMPAGDNIIRFYANDISSGTYFYTLYIDGALAETKKMLLVK